MVCIIDDREDVWNFAPNVIHVKPYCFFRNTGDINAPPPSSNETQQIKPAEVSKLTSLAEPEGKNQNCDKREKADGVKEDSSVLATHASNNDSTGTAQSTESASQAASLKNEQNNVGKTSASAEESDTKAKDKEVDSLRSMSDSVNNSDDYLLYLEEILVNVHKAYYDQYDKMKKEGGNSIPDLKTVVPDVRRKVLKCINIVFSSVIPTNCVPETSRFWTLAESLGATVSQELILDSSERRTTHVVASKLGTAKVNAAKKHSDICIVSLSWLLCCAERWERADERLFPLKKDFALSFHDGDKAFNPNNEHSIYEQVVEKPVKGWPAVKRPHGSSRKRSRRHQLKSEEEIFSERIFVEAGLSLSQEDIEDMDREVDQVCSEESDKESEKMEPSSDSSSGESLSSGDYPKGWKRHRKNDVTDIALEDAIDESSDADTIGSVDEEIADAVKQEFGNY
ncbi:RNA polymerase II subunit A C-terminal domain phosphatase, partial [Stegodyphus mimosarum]